VRRNWLLVVALLGAALGWVAALDAGALWDPYEVRTAELARRIAVNLFSGHGLVVAGADNTVPIRADLGRGELPFSSVALGFRVGGLTSWAGRLPLTLWALAGLGALYAALAELCSRRVATYAVLVLSTTPLYFLQARTLLGDAVTLASCTIAWSGLSAACLGRELSRGRRACFTLVGAVGLYAGFWCRGPLLGVSLPALAVGISAWLFPSTLPFQRRVRAALLLLGSSSFVLALWGLHAASTGAYSVFVGSALAAPATHATFDAAIGQLVHGAFPWSALTPMVLWLVFRPEEDTGPARAVVASAALGLGFGLFSVGWLTPRVGELPLPSVACFSVLIALGLAELERRATAQPLQGSLLAANAIVLGFDFHHHPEKTLSAFALSGPTLPEALLGVSSVLWLCGGTCVALIAVAGLYEWPSQPQRFRVAEYRQVLARLQEAWSGNLVFALLLIETTLVALLLLSALSERLVPLASLDALSTVWRGAVAWAAVAVPLCSLLPWGAMLLRDAARVIFRSGSGTPEWLPTRAQGLLLACAAIGGVASASFYPAFARQVSPKQAFERYRALHRDSEPLAVLGEQSGAARYQGAPTAEALDDVDSAIDWLSPGGAGRRWLVLKVADLPELNAQFRSREGRNLPVLGAASTEVLLASNRLHRGEVDENPLRDVVTSEPPPIQHPLRARLGSELDVLGWSVRSESGELVASVSPGALYRLVIYYRVLAPVPGSWQTFVHLDGLQQRFNADHEPLRAKYPMRWWQSGDVIADGTDLRLEPNFVPGNYAVYLGMFAGERRMTVTEGPASANRIEAGVVQVR